MKAHATMILCLALLPPFAGCRRGSSPPQEISQATNGGQHTAAGQDSATLTQRPPVDSQAISFMPMMWMHLDSMARWSPAQMQQMMAVHQQMAGRMLQMMGPTGMMGHGMMGPGMMGNGTWMGPGSPWTSLHDSIQNDLSTMPGLSGKDLAALSQAHIERMRRMMVLGMGMMPGGGWATMPGGCWALDSAGIVVGSATPADVGDAQPDVVPDDERDDGQHARPWRRPESRVEGTARLCDARHGRDAQATGRQLEVQDAGPR